MKKELLSILSLGLLISFAPGCGHNKNKKNSQKMKSPKTVKKVDLLNSKVLDIAYDDDTEFDEKEVVTKF